MIEEGNIGKSASPEMGWTDKIPTSKGIFRKGIKKPSQTTSVRILIIIALLITTSILLGISTREVRPLMGSIYLIFGFAVQRASFCSASLISSVVLSKDIRGITAILIAVLTAMLGFGVLSSLGLIKVYPSKISVVPAMVGGLFYGIGMVLSGGCVKGTLFKATEGRWPSILAVVGILVGIIGATSSWGKTLIAYLAKISWNWNPPPNLVASESASFSYLLTGIALIGLAAISLGCRRKILGFRLSGTFSINNRWSLYIVAMIIGLLGWVAFVIGPLVDRNYPLGASHIATSLLSLGFNGEIRTAGLLASTFILGSILSAWIRGDIRWRSAPNGMLILAFIGGLLVGMGAIIAQGCFVGQVLSGWALIATQALIFGIVMIFTNWVTTFFYLRGWR